MRNDLRNLRHLALLIALAYALQSSPVLAGMPSIRLSDVTALRVTNLSFFGFGLLLSAGAIKWLWNGLRSDFPRLPWLSYPKALGVVALWGLLFVVVLAMISGARELMTPGAWVKEGLTYRLKDSPAQRAAGPDGPDNDVLATQRAALERLGDVLAIYAANHGGAYPDSDNAAEIAPARWVVPPHGEVRFRYVPGLKTSDNQLPLAYVPFSDGGPVLVLLANGEIAELEFDEIRRRLETHEIGGAP